LERALARFKLESIIGFSRNCIAIFLAKAFGKNYFEDGLKPIPINFF